jgi:ABC-type sugar transport system ATPase subunit
MTVPIVEISGISKSFADVPVLHGVDLRIMPGEIIGLVGENGAGKSTLMNIIAGKLKPSSGSLAFDGKTVELDSIRQGQQRGVRFVHQELSTAGALSVAENIFLGGYLANRAGFINHRRLNDEARKILGRVGLGHIDPRTPLGNLRSGEQQLIELAKAVAEEPRLLILDEPTSSLTPAEGRHLFELAHELAARKVGMIFITHRLEEALEHCDRIVVLRDGRRIVDLPAKGTTKSDLILHMVGKPATFAYRPHGSISDKVRIKVENLADQSHLAGIDLSARGGEIVGLFGLVGAGRTEFLETLYGFRNARSGSVEIDGVPMRLGSVTHAVRAGLFMLPEGRKTRGILPTHSVRRNISVSGLVDLARFGFVDRQEEDGRSGRLADALNIRMADIRQPITSLSGGNQQKALFARALLAKPKVLLLDEPTHGVDVGAKAEIYDIISRLARDGTAVIVASSELPEILAIADRCVVFAGGRVAADLAREEMTEENILAQAFALQAADAARGAQVHG